MVNRHFSDSPGAVAGGAAVYSVEIDGTTFDLMERFGKAKASEAGDR
jgi:hypothetical protein